MKAAVLGTSDYHATMQQVAKNALQRQAGFVPQVARGGINVHLPLLRECFAIHADTIVRVLLDDGSLFNCNPRSPYLFLAWMLGGLGSPYRVHQSIQDDSYHRCIAFAYMLLALGQAPQILMSRRYYRFRHHSDNDREMAENIADIAATAALVRDGTAEFRVRLTTNAMLDDLIERLLNSIAKHPEKCPEQFYNPQLPEDELKQLAGDYLTCGLREWMYLSDDELLPIIRQLMLDLVSKSPV